MMTFILLLFFGAPTQKPTEIIWTPGLELTWQDFTKRLGAPEIYKAYSHTGIRYEATAPNGIVDIQVIPFFSTRESWVHVDFMNDNLLNHERGHFYITVIYAKMMDDALKAFEVGADEFTKNSLQNNVQDIFNAFYAEMDAAQKRYDRETNHGLDEEIQYKWDLWFKEKMALIDSVNQR